MNDAIAGKLSQRTQINNASSGGAFAGIGGVQASERRLRLLIGMPISDGVLLRPMDEPSIAPVTFDWESIAAEAIRLRSELQQQRLLVKRLELEAIAAKNFLMPTLDVVSIYRIRGLDRNLAGPESAFGDLGSGDLQEYEASIELKLPVGFRQGHLAVRNAKFQLARAKAVLLEQERQIIHDLTAVVAESDRAYTQMETNLNRYLAASDAFETLSTSREAGMPIDLEQLLDAQRRVSESQTRYFQSLAEYTIASKNVQFEKGTLLQTTNLFIADGGTQSLAIPFVPPPMMDAEVDSDIDLGDEVFDRNSADTNESSNIIDTDPATDSAVETLPPPALNGPQNVPDPGTTLDLSLIHI